MCADAGIEISRTPAPRTALGSSEWPFDHAEASRSGAQFPILQKQGRGIYRENHRGSHRQSLIDPFHYRGIHVGGGLRPVGLWHTEIHDFEIGAASGLVQLRSFRE